MYRFLSLALGFGMVLALGCSSHRPSGAADGGASQFGSAGNRGYAGNGYSGSGGSIGIGTAGSRATGTDAGVGIRAFDAAQFTPTCDTSVAPVTACGATTCPAPAANARQCTVVCCSTNNECGTRQAIMLPPGFGGGFGGGFGMTCTVPPPPAKADPRCPTETVNNQVRQGCCTANNQCGLISPTNASTCTPRSQVRVGGVALKAQACDAAATDAG